MNDKTYVVAPGRIASHSGDGKNYYEGQEIDLSHLNAEQLAAVLESGVVVEKVFVAKTVKASAVEMKEYKDG